MCRFMSSVTRKWKMRTFIGFLSGLLCANVAFIATPLWAANGMVEEEPIPSSVDEMTTSIERTYEKKPERPGFFPWLKVQLQDTPPFFRDTQLSLRLRTVYLDRTNNNGSINEAWALGGALSYKSGWLYDRIRLGSVLYTSQPLVAPDNHDGTDLLAPGQKGYTVFGQLYGQIKVYDGTFLTLYRSEYSTPYLSKDDSRMTPNTFEGYTFQGVSGGTDGSPSLKYGGGYITKIKDKNSDGFEWMSRKAGAAAQRGVALAGALFSHGGFSIGAIDYYCNDIINIGYAETRYALRQGEGVGAHFAAQFTDQRSVGDNLLTGSSFSTNQVGVEMDAGYRGGILTLAYTANSRDDDLRFPWSGYPGYTNSMIYNFNHAGENAFSAKISYDFSGLGLKGVAAFAEYTRGWGRVNPKTKAGEDNEEEIDADLQWRPKGHYLEGLWLRGRYGVAHQYEGAKAYTHDVRVYVNYEIPLL
jgi:hypothetical protein